MKKLFIIILLFTSAATAFGQIITGTVLDNKTNIPVSSAVVYISGTFTGTYTDQNGRFQIKLPGDFSGPLTVSSIGYFSVNIDDPEPGKQLKIYLSPKVYELNEVVVSASYKASQRARRANLLMFKDAFLGQTMNAARCSIENEKELIFDWDPDSMILKAFCSGPIMLENKGLGYNVTYYLDVFRYSGMENSLLIAGNIIFREDESAGKTSKAILKRRETAYLGSRMHFFRELWADNLDSAGFTIKTLDNKKLSYNDIVIEGENGRKYIKEKDPVVVRYYSKSGGSRLSFENDSVFFERDGFYDALDIVVWGEMGRLRVADWLPYEYSPEKDR